MVSMPGAMPVTIPDEEPIVAIKVCALLQVPPVSALASAVVAPGQTCCVPVIAAAAQLPLPAVMAK